MGIPDDDALRIGRWCAEQEDPALRDQLRIECEIADHHVTIYENRPPWDGQGDWARSPIARLRITPATGEWCVDWCDGNSRWREDDSARRTRDVGTLLDHVASDPDSLFWG